MTLKQLNYVIEIAQCRSISEAAKNLYISQPSLSAAVRELEDELGFEIFLRSSKGISVSSDGLEFLSYARQVKEQFQLLESRYLDTQAPKREFSVSAQHYSFVVNAFVNIVKAHNDSEYKFTLRETATYEIIDDVKNLRSEIGVLYLNDFNRSVIERILKENHLTFNPLFTARPHVFISRRHPLADKALIRIEDLDDYPYLSFEQGIHNSFYFSEEILSVLSHKKEISVTDRATLFNLVIGLNGYTISTGIIDEELNGSDIIARPLDVDESICVGWISNGTYLSKIAKEYITELSRVKTV